MSVLTSPAFEAYSGGFTANGTRRIVHSLAAANGSASTFQSGSWTFEVPFTLPVTPTRWRIRLANKSVTTTGAGSAVISGFYFGQLNLDTNGIPNGTFTATPTQTDGSTTLSTTGVDFVGAWQTAPIAAGKVYGIAYAVTLGAGVYAQHQSYVWFGNATNSPPSVATPGTALSPYMGGPFDLRIEYEYAGAHPSVLFLGASVTGSYSSFNPSLVCQVPFMSYPQQFAAAHGYAVSVTPIISAVLADYATVSGNWRYDRLALSTANIDTAVICEMVGNSIYSGQTLAQIKASTLTLIGNLTTLGIKRILAATCIPFTGATATQMASGTVTTAAAANATTLISSVDLGTSGVMAVGVGLKQDLVTVTARSGTGPYTYTVSGMTHAHAIGERHMGVGETIRDQYNNWIRQSPAGLSGVVDMARAVESSTTPNVADPAISDADGIHILTTGQNRLAAAIPNLS